MSDVAHAVVRRLVVEGVDAVFLNPGTDTAPFQEAFASLAAAGERVPTVVTCPHETVALAAAHAYFAVTGRPQVVMVHVDVGTQNLGSMLHNAWRADAGVVIIAGRTPITAAGELAGGRSTSVHWMQDVPDQAGILRGYVKHAADVTSPVTAERDLARAVQLARARPTGPVYLTFARELLLAAAPAPSPDLGRLAVPSPAWPEPTAIAAAAERLVAAERPVIVTVRAGRDPAVVADLVGLVDAVAATLIDGRERVNVPSDHPRCVTSDADSAAALADADVVVCIDAPIPWVPAFGGPPADAVVISIDDDPARSSMPAWSHPVDIAIAASPSVAVRQLLAAVRDRAPDAFLYGNPAMGDRKPVQKADERAPTLDAGLVGRVLGEVIDAIDLVVEEATTNFDAFRTALPRTVPGTYFRSGGSGLGWGLGGALGVKLACPDSRVVAVVGDGAFLFAPPVAALWAMTLADAPVLTIVLENGGYAASRAPVLALFPDGASARSATVIGTQLGDKTGRMPDLAAIGAACGAFGRRVVDATDLRPALVEALTAVDDGRSAVVVVPVPSPWN